MISVIIGEFIFQLFWFQLDGRLNKSVIYTEFNVQIHLEPKLDLCS